MTAALIVSDLIAQVRDELDEFNTDQVSDDTVVNYLNRAQRNATNIISRKFVDAFLASALVNLTSTDTYDIPADVYAGRIEKLEIVQSGRPLPMERRSYRNMYSYSGTSGMPCFWCQKGRQFVVAPTPASPYQVKIWYTKIPPKLVTEQGRITAISSTYVLVDTVGDTLTTSSDDLNSYINFIDRLTGEVKGSAQIQSISGSRITIRSTPLRTTVLGNTIAGTVPTDLAVDDYVCITEGTCVSTLDAAYVDYLVIHAAVSLKRKLGDDSPGDYSSLQVAEAELEKIWAGREPTLRVQRVSSRWSTSRRLWR